MSSDVSVQSESHRMKIEQNKKTKKLNESTFTVIKLIKYIVTTMTINLPVLYNTTPVCLSV